MSPRRPLLVLVPSGAGERGPRTPLNDARTPHLDRLAARATVLNVRTTPDGLHGGTEVGLPTMLGVPVRTAPSRGYLDAAALGIEPLDGTAAWRLDLVSRGGPWVPADPQETESVLSDAIGAPVHHVRGHRYVLVGPREWGDAPDRIRATRPRRLASRAWRRRVAAAEHAVPDARVTIWGRANPVRWHPPVDRRVVVVAVDGSPAAGVARVSGLELRTVPRDPGHAIGEMRLLRAAAAEVLAQDEPLMVVVHSHHVDDAAHGGRRADKVALLGALDTELTGPLVAEARTARAAFWWCPDVATDGATGRHLTHAVPSVWTPDARDGTVRHLRPVTSGTLRHAPTADGRTLLASLLRMADGHAA